MWTEVFVVALALLASTAFTRLLETVSELRRTRAELARVAVTEERERFSRDLHDLLGHTLSVMVVKAQAVRRLAPIDPEAAAQHAADIERVGRTALLDVRQAVDAMRAPSLPEELVGARDALESAGIRRHHRGARRPARRTPAPCWPGRCARPSPTCCATPGRAPAPSRSPRSATRCELAVTDDGVGRTDPTHGRPRSRAPVGSTVCATGCARPTGRSMPASTGAGFRLVASVPAGIGARR